MRQHVRYDTKLEYQICVSEDFYGQNVIIRLSQSLITFHNLCPDTLYVSPDSSTFTVQSCLKVYDLVRGFP